MDLLARGSFSMKTGRILWSRNLRIRAAVVVLVILLLRLGAFRGSGINRIRGVLASDSSFSRSDWGSRSGLAYTSGATGGHRCHKKMNPNW